MVYYRAWYRRSSESAALDPLHPDWIVHASDEAEARRMVLRSMGRHEPERGFAILFAAFADEDEGVRAYAGARQTGQALM